MSLFKKTVSRLCAGEGDTGQECENFKLLKPLPELRNHCPDCGSKTKPVMTPNWAAIAGAFLLVVAVGGLVYFLLPAPAKVGTADRIEISNGSHSTISGEIRWDFAAGMAPKNYSSRVSWERQGDEYRLKPVFTAASGDRLHFEFQRTSNSFYVFYRDTTTSRKLYPKPRAEEMPAAVIRVPLDENMLLGGGAGVETFIVVAAGKPVSQLAGLPRESISNEHLDAVIKKVATDKNCVVARILIPHN